jgi:hypothetical protein
MTEPVAAEHPFIPDLGDAGVDEMRALKAWHEEQADKMEIAVRGHRTRALHLDNAIRNKTEVVEV